MMLPVDIECDGYFSVVANTQMFNRLSTFEDVRYYGCIPRMRDLCRGDGVCTIYVDPNDTDPGFATRCVAMVGGKDYEMSDTIDEAIKSGEDTLVVYFSLRYIAPAKILFRRIRNGTSICEFVCTIYPCNRIGDFDDMDSWYNARAYPTTYIVDKCVRNLCYGSGSYDHIRTKLCTESEPMRNSIELSEDLMQVVEILRDRVTMPICDIILSY